MEDNLDELSFSTVVNLVQHDKIVGKGLLIDIAQKLELLKEKREHLEKDMKKLNFSISNLEEGTEHIFQHLKLEKPLAIICEDRLLVISERSITFEYNIL